jgi:hypothetical protein
MIVQVLALFDSSHLCMSISQARVAPFAAQLRAPLGSDSEQAISITRGSWPAWRRASDWVIAAGLR